MSWERELEGFVAARAWPERWGAPNACAASDSGRLTVRERIERLFDPGSFRETGRWPGVQPMAPPAGSKASCRPTRSSVRAASTDAAPWCRVTTSPSAAAPPTAIWQKAIHAERLADLRLPLVRLVDGTGGGGSVKTLEQMGFSYVPPLPGFELVVRNLAIVPVVAGALGPVADLGRRASSARTSRSSLETRRSCSLPAHPWSRQQWARRRTRSSSAAPGSRPARAASTTSPTTRRTRSHSSSASSYLPQRLGGAADRRRVRPSRPARAGSALSIVPRDRRRPFRGRAILAAVLDRDSRFELGAAFGRPLITCLARLGGRPVRVLASDPEHYGGLTANASEKLARFVDICDQFHLPVVNLVDVPGFVIGTAAERAGDSPRRPGAVRRLPGERAWVSILVRKVYGVAGAGRGDGFGSNLRYAWPSGDWGSLPIEGGLEAAYRRELEAAADPAALRAEIAARLDAVRSPFRSAEHFSVEEIIDPRDTRPLLCDWAERAHELIRHDLAAGPKGRGPRPEASRRARARPSRPRKRPAAPRAWTFVLCVGRRRGGNSSPVMDGHSLLPADPASAPAARAWYEAPHRSLDWTGARRGADAGDDRGRGERDRAR